MIRHLDESSNVVASRKRLIKRIILGAYCAFWPLILLYYWLIGERYDAFARSWQGMHREEICFLFVFPLCVAVITGFMGASESFGKRKWLFVPISGALLVLLNCFTAELKDMISVFYEMDMPFNLFELFADYFAPLNLSTWVATVFLFGCIGCAVGIFIGTFVRYALIVRKKKIDENNNPPLGENAEL